jgi:hypothetical protein
MRRTTRHTAAFACLVLLSQSAVASAATEALPSDGPTYAVEHLEIVYDEARTDLPDPESLLATEVWLSPTPSGFVAPRPGAPMEETRLNALPEEARFHASALRSISEAVVRAVEASGIGGILVTVDPEDLAPRSGRDIRAPGRSNLRFLVFWGRIAEVHTVARGERFEGEAEGDRIDRPEHRLLGERSPLAAGDPVRLDVLHEFVARQNRHPGRLVRPRLSPGDEPGTTYLDYEVAELEPWYGFAQISDTGTDETTIWRTRFGFAHHQVTGNEDILRIDYLTGDFDQVHVGIASYEAPLLGSEFWRYRLEGAYSKFDATELGFLLRRFKGTQWHAKAELSWNFWQHDAWFVDAVASARWQSIEVEQVLFEQTNDSDFFVPSVGIRVERRSRTSNLEFEFDYEWNLANLAGTDRAVNPVTIGDSLSFFGRSDPARDWKRIQWHGRLAFFIEPLLFGEDFDDPSTPRTSTLAHEVEIRLDGQTALSNGRMIPEFERIAGGLYTVRGYPQSIAAGDDVYLASIEYRLHLPRLLGFAQPVELPVLGQFRVAPDQVFQNPDWDLILRVFFDAARLEVNRPTGSERSRETLRSTGLGLELVVKRNFSVRIEGGVALDEARGGVVRRWSREYHLVATALF